MPSASSSDVNNPVIHARERHGLDFLSASQDQRELALIRQRFRLFLRDASVIRFRVLRLLRPTLSPLLRRALVLALALVLVSLILRSVDIRKEITQ